ncbi:hypothetical protein ACS0TY_002317 [Phlomoides rotata]
MESKTLGDGVTPQKEATQQRKLISGCNYRNWARGSRKRRSSCLYGISTQYQRFDFMHGEYSGKEFRLQQSFIRKGVSTKCESKLYFLQQLS